MKLFEKFVLRSISTRVNIEVMPEKTKRVTLKKGFHWAGFQLPGEHHKFLNSIADERDMTISSVLREMVKTAFDKTARKPRTK